MTLFLHSSFSVLRTLYFFPSTYRRGDQLCKYELEEEEEEDRHCDAMRAPAAFILFSACLSRYAEVMMMPAGMHGRGILAFTDGRLITHASSPFTEIAELGHGAVIIG